MRSKMEELLASTPRKPRTTAKHFAADLKTRIERAAKAFDLGDNKPEFMSGMRYVLGIVDAALSDYDVREPADFLRATPPAPPPERPSTPGSGSR